MIGLARKVVCGLFAFHVSSCYVHFPIALTVSRPTGHNYLGFDIIGDLAFGSPFGMTGTHEPVLGSPTLLPSPSMVLA
jgi:hypothetical protein